MAHYQAVRPVWYPRGIAVHYVMNNQLYVRGWPSHYRDANTAAQREQRGKMRQVCLVLPYLKKLLAEGYTPQQKANGRCVGSYHVAVAKALREWFIATPTGPTFLPSAIQLTEATRPIPGGMAASRQQDRVALTLGAALPWTSPKLLLAARCSATHEWIAEVVPMDGATSLSLTLPRGWSAHRIELWTAFVGENQRARSRTIYSVLEGATAAPGSGPHGQTANRIVTPPLTPPPSSGKSRCERRAINVPNAPHCCACRFGLTDAYCMGAPHSELAKRYSAARKEQKPLATPNPNRAPLGPIHGAMGATVFATWKATPYIRSKPQTNTHSPSRRAITQRATLAKYAQLASQLLPMAKVGLRAEMPSGKVFTALMKRLFETRRDPSQLRLSAGTYHQVQSLKLTETLGETSLEWSSPAASADDWIHLCIVSADGTATASQRVPLSNGHATFHLPQGERAYFGYAFITNSDGKEVGPTTAAQR